MDVFSVQMVLKIFINLYREMEMLGKARGESQILMKPSMSV